MKAIRMAVAAALLAQAGLPVAVAQTAAWARMVCGGQTVAQAVGGQKPCALCLKIRGAKSGSSLAARSAAPLDWRAPAASASLDRKILAFSSSYRGVVSAEQAPLDPPPPRKLPS